MKRTIAITLMMSTLLTALLFVHAEAALASVDEIPAKSTALMHAALTENDVTALTVKRDIEDGVEVYEVEFWKDTTEYDYDVDAATGEILSFDIESKGAGLPQFSEAGIAPETALKTALDKVGVREEDVTIVEASIKSRAGQAKYKIEFISGNMEYEIEIDAASGTILEYDAESEDD